MNNSYVFSRSFAAKGGKHEAYCFILLLFIFYVFSEVSEHFELYAASLVVS
jgi:hypothetical protein